MEKLHPTLPPGVTVVAGWTNDAAVTFDADGNATGVARARMSIFVPEDFTGAITLPRVVPVKALPDR